MARPTSIEGLSGETPMVEAVRIYAAARLADARRFVLLVRRDCEVEAVHDLRVSLRRLRAVLDLAGRTLRKAEREAKRLQDVLGEVRDLQLHVAWLSAEMGHGRAGKPAGKTAGNLAGKATGKSTSKAGAGLVAELLAERRKRLEGRADKLEDSLRRWADEEPALLGALAKLELNGKLGGHRQRARLRRRLRELQESMHAARGSLEPREAHALRIAVKKLRYDAELAEPALPEAAGAVLKALVPLQEPLGELHDCDVRLGFLAREAKKRGEDGASSSLRTRELARRGRLGQKVGEELARFRDDSVPRALRKGLS
jgi:CHAD domain-containing protein